MKKEILIKSTALGKIEYSVQGKGKPILFLHGGHSNCREFLLHKGFDLQEFLVLTPSRPGYGQTPLERNNTPKRAADLMLSLLDELKMDKVVVYAVSAGGPTAIALTAKHPERVSKLVLASAVTKKWLDKSEPSYKLAQWLFHPNFEAITWRTVRFFSWLMPKIIAKSFYAQFTTRKTYRLIKEEVTDLLAALRNYSSKRGFLCDIDHTVDLDDLSKIKAPTLIIHSENDNSVSIDHAFHAHRRIEGSKLELLHNKWGHLFWLGHDSEYAIQKTIDFIAER